MAVTVVETVGSASANSFVSVAEADAYLEARLNSSAWTGTEPKKIAVIEATRELTRLMWVGSRTDTTQALSWPRTYAIDPDVPAPSLLGDIAELYFDDDVIPQRVKDATCELALEFLKAGTSDLAAQDAKQNVIQKTIGPISTTYSEPYQRARGLARFPRVLELIAPLLDPTATGGLEMVRT